MCSAGRWWSGQPNTVRLDELDVICAVLGCDVGELLLPDPVPGPAAGQGTGAVAEARCDAPVPDRLVPATAVTGRSAGRRRPGRPRLPGGGGRR